MTATMKRPAAAPPKPNRAAQVPDAQLPQFTLRSTTQEDFQRSLANGTAGEPDYTKTAHVFPENRTGPEPMICLEDGTRRINDLLVTDPATWQPRRVYRGLHFIVGPTTSGRASIVPVTDFDTVEDGALFLWEILQRHTVRAIVESVRREEGHTPVAIIAYGDDQRRLAVSVTELLTVEVRA